MLAAATAAALACVPASAAAAPTPGAAGSGDPFFPGLGNGGYDVGHYDVRLSYAPKPRTIRGAVTISATAIQDLSSFTLDMRRWLLPLGASIDGTAAVTRRKRAKVRIAPATPIPSGAPFTLVLRYRGRPKAVRDPDGSSDGWMATGDGALVAAEPQGAPGWLPSNASLGDKATLSITATVPRPLKAVANGRLLEVTRLGAKTSFSWRASEPMAAYLATLAIGRFRLIKETVAGLPSIVAVDPRLARRVPKGIGRTGGMISLFERSFGAYPFDSVGAIVDAGKGIVALETQTRPIYDFVPPGGIHAHEIAHQWWGDAVGFARWRDIWLAEGFAQWSMWLWRDEVGAEKLGRSFKRSYSVPARFKGYWNPPPGKLGNPRHLFGLSVYERGAMTVEALRRELGNDAFYGLLRDWIAQRRYGTGTIPDFIALAEQHAGRDLGEFFELWLYRKGKPRGPLAHAPQ